MADTSTMSNLFKGFSKLNRADRMSKLVEIGALTKEDVKTLQSKQTLNPDLAEHFIENVIGYFQMPLGVGAYMKIDGQEYTIPMAVEETSIIASLSKTAKWISHSGNITTETIGNQTMTGQIQFAKVNDFKTFSETITANKQLLIDTANDMVASGLVKRGGGVKDIIIRKIVRDDERDMAVLHVLVDTCDAMGANIITQICEHLKAPIYSLTNETASMCILTNLNENKLTKATVVIKDIEPKLGNKIVEGSLFGALDHHRATTNNKGVLNGIDAVLLATGNDWRAVEAGVHSYACKDGTYKAITTWKMHESDLVGELIAPINVGIVGGVTKLHPTARMCLKMMKIKSASHLSRILAAVGLVQNLGAITALTTVGLVQGHMKLHISNLSLTAGAKKDEVPLLQTKLEEILRLRKIITLSNAIELLKDLRSQKSHKIKLENEEQTI